eukprot:g8686.t1
MNMKVDSAKALPNGFVGGSQPSSVAVSQSTIVKKEDIDFPVDKSLMPGTGTPLEGNQQDTQSCSSESPYSVSDIITDDLDSLSSDPEPLQGDHELSDLDESFKSGTDANCAAIALESLLENLEFVPSEVNRLLKMIGLLDQKCEEITELLDRPSEEWFDSRRNKKQKKSSLLLDDDDLSLDEDSTTNVHSTRALLVYRKIYEGQDDTDFDTYISKLKKARRLEKQKQLHDRQMDLSSIDDSFKISYEKNGDGKVTMNGGQIQKTQDSTRISQGSGIKGSEVESAAESSQNMKTTSAKRERGESDPIDQYFSMFDKDYGQLQSERAWDGLLESEGINLDVKGMNENWKERFEDIQRENALNQKSSDNIEDLDKLMEDKLSLLWRYTLRKKALTRKLYETALHHYATLIQELEPQKFAASLGCYPEATIMQNMLLNDVEEEFLRPNEMLELYKDVGDMIDQFDEKELITNPNPQMPLIVKAEDSTVGIPTGAEIDKNASMNGALRPDKQTFGSNYSRLGHPNGTMSNYSASGGSFPSFDRSDVRLSNGNNSNAARRARNKRHKPTKPPVGMAHAANSPQSTGRLLTYHDIATSSSSAKLAGHSAELFWPDDDLWYLIRISSVDPETKTAFIVYTTGETESLDLDDIVREGHMSLLPEVEDTDVSNEEGCVPRQITECEVNEDAMSELSASEPGALYSDEASVDGDDDEDGSDDEDDEIVAMHHRRPPRRAEIKSERVEIRHKS